jgi:hypothetical protein
MPHDEHPNRAGSVDVREVPLGVLVVAVVLLILHFVIGVAVGGCLGVVTVLLGFILSGSLPEVYLLGRRSHRPEITYEVQYGTACMSVRMDDGEGPILCQLLRRHEGQHMAKLGESRWYW